MAIDRPTTEALKADPTKLGKSNVSQLNSGVFMIKGPEFHERFMANYIMPRRFECASMVMASHIQRFGVDMDPDDLVLLAWKIADAFVLAERSTLDKRMSQYFDLYMEHNKQTEDVINALIDSQQDYSR